MLYNQRWLDMEEKKYRNPVPTVDIIIETESKGRERDRS
jgi:hypothetical protein